MVSRSLGKVMTIASAILAIAFYFGVFKNRPPSAGDNWEVVADFGNIKMVYVSPRYYPNEEWMAGVLDTLIGTPFRAQRGLFNLYFFDDKESTPDDYRLLNKFNRGEEYPFTEDQFRHLKAHYTFAMPDQSNFCYIRLADTTVFPPKVQQIWAQVHPGYTGEDRWGYLPNMPEY
jgi:hypothetical protein